MTTKTILNPLAKKHLNIEISRVIVVYSINGGVSHLKDLDVDEVLTEVGDNVHLSAVLTDGDLCG
jgi:hypothetical protein